MALEATRPLPPTARLLQLCLFLLMELMTLPLLGAHLPSCLARPLRGRSRELGPRISSLHNISMAITCLLVCSMSEAILLKHVFE
jgi:hypothetical protein